MMELTNQSCPPQPGTSTQPAVTYLERTLGDRREFEL